MDEATQQKLKALFQREQDQKDAAQKEAEEREQRRQQQFAKFVEIRDSVIKPVMDEMAHFLESQEWGADVVTENERPQEGGGILPPSICIYVSNEAGNSPRSRRPHECAHFQVSSATGGGKVAFHMSTIMANRGGSSGGAGGADFQEITKDFMEKKLSNFVEKLFKPF